MDWVKPLSAMCILGILFTQTSNFNKSICLLNPNTVNDIPIPHNLDAHLL